jgi:hypothetical protein
MSERRQLYTRSASIGPCTDGAGLFALRVSVRVEDRNEALIGRTQ